MVLIKMLKLLKMLNIKAVILEIQRLANILPHGGTYFLLPIYLSTYVPTYVAIYLCSYLPM